MPVHGVFANTLLAYAFPGLESIPSILPLLALAASAFLGVLLWPIYALIRFFRKPKVETPEETKAEAAEAAPATPEPSANGVHPSTVPSLNHQPATAHLPEKRGEGAPTSS